MTGYLNRFFVVLICLIVVPASLFTEIEVALSAEKGLPAVASPVAETFSLKRRSLGMILDLLLSPENQTGGYIFTREPVAEIIGAPSGLANAINPITISGQDVWEYKFKLDDGNYSKPIPVNEKITFSADVDIYGETFIAGSSKLQELFDAHPGYIDSVTFRNVKADTRVLFLLNDTRVFLEEENTLYLEGSNLDQLEVHMNSTPGTSAVVVEQSLMTNPQHITYALSTATPDSDFIRVINRSGSTASFRFNLNNKLFASDADLLSAIQAMAPEYEGEPIQRKVWRFIRDNRYHWYALLGYNSRTSWIASSPALFFNSIGFGMCGHSAQVFCQIMTLLGQQTKIWGLNGHIVSEVLINGRWEMYDCDLRVYYINRQGEVASVEDLAADPLLITSPILDLSCPETLELSCAHPSAYMPLVADIYSSIEDNVDDPWYKDNIINNYSLSMQIPPGGMLEFPAVFGESLLSYGLTDVPYYTNARLTVPRGWEGTLNTPLVIHSIGYDGPHKLSVSAYSFWGTFQQEPTIANWTTDSWAPITWPYPYPYPTNEVTLQTSEPATVYYTTDGSIPTTASSIYTSKVIVPEGSILTFFGIDAAGNPEKVKYFDPEGGYLDYAVSNTPLPVQNVSLAADKSSPQVQGSVITFKASATGGSGDYEYRFLFRDLNGIWRLPHDSYVPLSSWRWNTAGMPAGTYYILVYARSKGSDAYYEDFDGFYFTISP